MKSLSLPYIAKDNHGTKKLEFKSIKSRCFKTLFSFTVDQLSQGDSAICYDLDLQSYTLRQPVWKWAADEEYLMNALKRALICG